MTATGNSPLEMHQLVARRIARWLELEWPKNTTKEVAREFATSPKTVEKWLGGQHPASKFVAAMTQKWGREFLLYVYEPVLNEGHQLTLIDEIDRLRLSIAVFQERYRAEKNIARHSAHAGQVQLPLGEVF